MQAKILRAKIFAIEAELLVYKENLKNIEEACQHNFGKVKYDPYSQSDYTNSSCTFPLSKKSFDVPVNMKTVDRWKRECLLCGKVEYTQEYNLKSEKIPVFDKLKK